MVAQHLGGVSASVDELNKLDGLIGSVNDLNIVEYIPRSVAFTIGEEGGDVINVACQVKDADGANMDGVLNVLAFLTDSSGGLDIAATAPDGGVAAGTNGKILVQVVAGKMFWLQTNEAGQVDINITESGADTWYLLVNLIGTIFVTSGAINFTT